MDQFDVVRAYYRAFNSGDMRGAAALYDPACITENVFPDREGTVHGREQNAERMQALARTSAGGFEEGAYFRVRTIGGIGTGWGWVQSEWTARVLDRASGRVRRFGGYSHFLVEDGLIRRHRSVAREEAPAAAPAAERLPSERHYPSRPVVGVGAVILVTEADRQRLSGDRSSTSPSLEHSSNASSPGVVLIKRRYEPLANQWSLPGGTLEVGETLEAGVAREIVEETGLAVDVGPVVEVFDRILFDDDQRVRYHFVLIDYLCRPVGGHLRAGSDVSAVAIANPVSLAEYGLTQKATAVIAAALRMTAR